MISARRTVSLLACVVSFATIAASQGFLVHRPFRTGVAVEAALPQLKSHPGATSTLTILRATVHLPAGERSILHVSVPYIRRSYEASYSSPSYSYNLNDRDDGVMNLALGLLTSPSETSLWELMVTLPVISEQNTMLGFSGVLADLDRFEAYLRQTLALGAYGNYLTSESSVFIGRFRLGPTMLLPTGKQGGEWEMTVEAGAGVGARLGSFEAGAFASTRTIVTEETLFGDRTVIHLTLSAQATFGRFSAQAYYRLPQNENFQQAFYGTLGISGIVTW